MILYDPHADDNIFTPLSYFLLRRRALKKYGYIRSALTDKGLGKIYFSYKNSSLPKSLTELMPVFMLRIFIMLEVFIWRKINNIPKDMITNTLEGSDVFLFGYKKFSKLEQCEFSKSRKIYIHLTHYHTYEYNNIYKSENVFFCFDNDVSNVVYFKHKFPEYDKGIIILPFYVNDRFNYDYNINKVNSVAVTGTYHDFNPNEVDFGIYNRDRATLHPIRHELANRKLNTCFNVKLGLYRNPTTVKSLIKLLTSYRQKRYFSFDIADFYAQHKFSIVAGEGTGAVAIGTLESIASGCIAFVTIDEISGLDIPEGSYIIYDGTINDLLKKVDLAINNNDEENKIIQNDILPQFRFHYLSQYFGEIFNV
ncbi:hypothetical protein AB4374_21830 [Vibrio splendidus]